MDRSDIIGYRERAMYPLSVIAFGCFVPFVVHNYAAGRYTLATAILVTIAIFAVNALAISRKKSPPLPFWVVLIPLATAMAISLRTQGVYGAFWSYPTVLFFYFVLPPRVARICSLSLLLFASVMVYRYNAPDLAVRFAISLALVIVVVNVILNIIADLQAQLVEQAVRDPLTGAFNRRHMDTCLGDAIERHRRSGAPASLLLFDIDHFKRVNDQRGHAVGDQVLQRLVKLVDTRSRKLDALFRIGGEEFILLLPDTRGRDAVTVAESLRVLVGAAPLLDRESISISVGVSELQPGDSLDSWIKGADDALYLAKRGGRNQVAEAPRSRTAAGSTLAQTIDAQA